MTVAEPEWVVRERVPVYDAHELVATDPKTGKETSVRVDEDRLARIAQRRNAKIRRTGDESPVIVGHTRRGVPEWEQPPIVGYADRYEVGPHDKDGRPVLYARVKFYPTCKVGGEEMTAEEVMRRFPRRSAEIWLEDDDLDAVSLLGPTTPARYLGLVRNSREEQQPPPESAEPAAEGAPVDQCQQLATAIMTVLEQFMGGGQQPAAAPPAPPPAAGPETPAQYAAACGPANAAMPGQKPDDLEKVRMQRDQEAIRTKRENDEVAALRTEITDLKLRYQRERREKDLIQLEAEGYDFDRGEELDRLTPLADEVYAKEFDRMKKRYSRSFTGARPVVTGNVPEADPSFGTPFAKPTWLERASQIQWDNPGKYSWEQCKELAQKAS